MKDLNKYEDDESVHVETKNIYEACYMNIALIFAGGAGQRMNSKALPKQFLKLHGKPIIIYTLEIFDNCEDIDGIVIVCLKGWENYLNGLIKKYGIIKVTDIVEGGKTGQESIYNGITKIKEKYADNDIVLVHDGVRPLITNDLIKRNIESVQKYGNAISSATVTETILLDADNDESTNRIIDRNSCKFAKAPQSFWVKDLYNAHIKAIADKKTDFTDSACLVQYYGARLHMIECSTSNIKITTPTDFYLFRAIVEAMENEQIEGY